MAENTGEKNKSPLVKVLEILLEKWITSQCNYIESISLDIKGTLLELIKGYLSEVNLYARLIDFQGIKFDSIKIKSDPIHIRINNQKKKMSFKHGFNIQIIALLNEIGINEITPIITDFSEKKKINMKRCNKIIISAIKQSNNYFKPKINDVISFNDFVKNM